MGYPLKEQKEGKMTPRTAPWGQKVKLPFQFQRAGLPCRDERTGAPPQGAQWTEHLATEDYPHLKIEWHLPSQILVLLGTHILFPDFFLLDWECRPCACLLIVFWRRTICLASQAPKWRGNLLQDESYHKSHPYLI